MPRYGPLKSIFDPPARRGLVPRGAQIGTLPPCIPILTLSGSVTDSTILDLAQAVAKSGDGVFLSSGYGTVSLDVSDPTGPTIQNSIRAVSMQSPQEIVVVGSYLYVLYDTNIAIIDPADTFNVPLASAPFALLSGVVDGSYLYGSSNGGIVYVIDITSPLAPTLVGSVATTFNNCFGIEKSGNYVFGATSGSNRFYVVDVTTPSAPTNVTSLSGSNYNNARDLTISGNYAYLSAGSGLTIVDISTPTSPTLAAHVNATGTLGVAQGILKDGNNVYCLQQGAGTAFLKVFDATTPTAPTATASLTLSSLGDTQPRYLTKSGNYLYMTTPGQDRIRIIDVSTPSSPTNAGNFDSSTAIDDAVGMYLTGSDLYVSGERMFSKLDISSPTSPSVTWTKYGNWVSFFIDVAVVGDYLFGLQNQVPAVALGGVTTFDVSDPTDIAPVAHFSHADLFGATRMTTDGTYLYVASASTDRVTIINISNPLAVTHTASITHATNLDGPQDVAISGTDLYVAVANTDRLTAIDVSTPASPSIVGTVNHSTNLDLAICIAVNGSYAYVGCLLQNRLTVVDISNPSSPSIVGTVADATYLNRPLDIVYEDGKCFVACQTANRITVVDVSDPTAPVVKTSLQDNTNLNRLNTFIKDGDFLYVPASIGDRLTILEYECVQP